MSSEILNFSKGRDVVQSQVIFRATLLQWLVHNTSMTPNSCANNTYVKDELTELFNYISVSKDCIINNNLNLIKQRTNPSRK